MSWWDSIIRYYKAIGENYQVDPVLFVGIHIVATPLFGLAVWWIIDAKKKSRSLLPPVLTAAFIFNAANIYLIAFGRNVPWWIYAIVGVTTIISSYFTIKKIKNKLSSV